MTYWYWHGRLAFILVYPIPLEQRYKDQRDTVLHGPVRNTIVLFHPFWVIAPPSRPVGQEYSNETILLSNFVYGKNNCFKKSFILACETFELPSHWRIVICHDLENYFLFNPSNRKFFSTVSLFTSQIIELSNV